MSAIAPSDLLGQLRWRYATKRFDPSRPLSEGAWRTLREALVLAPSSYGLQPYRFVVVTDRALKERLRPVSWNQAQVVDCSHLVVCTIRIGMGLGHIERFVDRIAEVRGVPRDSLAEYRSFMVRDLVEGPRARVVDEWAARQVYIALGQLMAAAALIGVDACPLEGIDPPAYDRILGLDGFRTVVACAVGHRASDDKYADLPKVRLPEDELVVCAPKGA